MSCRFFCFPASFAYLNPFQQWLYDFENHLFTLRTIEGPNTTIKKGSNIHWSSRRKHDPLRAGGWKRFVFEDQGKLHLICLPGNMQVSSVASEGQYKKKYFYKIRKIWTSSSCSKVPPSPSLNASCVLLEHQWMFEPFIIVVFESLNCPQCEKVDLKFQICKRCWRSEDSAGHGGFFWRTELSLTVQNKQGTHEQPSQNKKTVVDHPGNHTQY